MLDLDKAAMFKAIKQMREKEFIKQNKNYIETSRNKGLMNFK